MGVNVKVGVAVGNKVGVDVFVAGGAGISDGVAVVACVQLDRNTSKSKVVRIRWLFKMLIPNLDFHGCQ